MERKKKMKKPKLCFIKRVPKDYDFQWKPMLCHYDTLFGNDKIPYNCFIWGYWQLYFMKGNKPNHPFFYFIGGLTKIATGLVIILTLGLYEPLWESSYYSWLIYRRNKY